MRRILVLGATGQIGAELTCRLTKLAEVVAPSRADADFETPGIVASLIRAYRPAIIWNCAAQTNVELAERSPAQAWQLNAEAPQVLARAAKEVGALLCHWSTDYVFDGESREPYQEDDPTGPVNEYGRSKLAGEQAIQQAGCRHLILRTGWVYSERRRNFLKSIVARGREAGIVDVVSDQLGAPTPAVALAETGVALTERWLAGNPPADGVYHVTAGGATSWSGFAEAIHARITELGGRWLAKIHPVPAHDYPSPVVRPAYSVLSNEKLRAATGLVLSDWHTLLERFLRPTVLAEL